MKILQNDLKIRDLHQKLVRKEYKHYYFQKNQFSVLFGTDYPKFLENRAFFQNFNSISVFGLLFPNFMQKIKKIH